MKNNWKDEFDKKFLCDCENPNRECYQDDECTVREMRGDLKNFIESLLAEQKKELIDLLNKDYEILKLAGKCDCCTMDTGMERAIKIIIDHE